jgi:hypothetical protein
VVSGGAASVVSLSSSPQADITNSKAANTANTRMLPGRTDLRTFGPVILNNFPF